MTEKELFSKETFLGLFKLSELERIEKEDKLFLIAKQMNVEKKFKESLKRYNNLFKQKIDIEEKGTLPKSKYNIENFNFGKYRCNSQGITDTKKDVKFSFIPIIPVERYINEDSGKEKIKIIFYKENEWKELVVDKSQLSISQKLLNLSDFGLDVTSENVKFYVNYFNELLNINDLKKTKSVSHIGWKDDDFIPYDNHGVFDGADEFRNIFKAIHSKGDYQTWKDMISELRKNKTMKILMSVVLASPLLEKLNIQPYMANLWSSMSGNGKTLSCMVAMSIWGNPDVGALRLSSNNTQNYYTVVASFMRNLTCYFDELQIIKKSKYLDTESLIMDLCNGTEKGRLTKNSQAREIKVWYNNFLFTSNDSLAKDNAEEQVYNRVIDIEVNEKLIDNGTEVARIIKNNYGFAGKEYIKYIQKIGFDEIYDRYKKFFYQIIENTKGTDKQASALASMLLADDLANECIFNDEEKLKLEDILDLVRDKEEIKTSVIAKNYIIDIINANQKRFDEKNYGEVWGAIREINASFQTCYINYQILIRELKKGGFEFNSIKKEWAKMNFLLKNSQGRYYHNTMVNTEKGNYVVLQLSIG